ncbi:BadF/BadG/BcrA/BcrD ATPase family protein, partial [Streptomyces sp. NPDC059466]|uniref:BadF/BadG/BcrA/BcrD ATPase family protein n=1 Tax=Streptomyces sp. NPDC059466 TaxID=3346843 RepID=UPI0036B33C67
MTAVLAVDLGKTGCRAVLWTGPDGPGHPVHEVPGSPGLAESGGVTAAVAAVTAAAALGGGLASALPAGRLDTVCVGAAGAAADPAAARSLAEQLLDALPTDEVAVTSDAVTAHAGALGGGAGVVLAAGTGAVTVGVGDGGTFARVDGWGPWIGEEGRGAWIGRAGLRAALRSHDGRGPATALTSAAADRFGDLDRLPATVGHSANQARLTAAFAPVVAGAASDGDAVANGNFRDAAAALSEALVSAGPRIGG